MLLVQGPGFENHSSKPKSFCQLHSRTETKDCFSIFNHYKMITLEGMIPVYSKVVTNDQTTPKSHTTLKSGKIFGGSLSPTGSGPVGVNSALCLSFSLLSTRNFFTAYKHTQSSPDSDTFPNGCHVSPIHHKIR